MPFQKGHPQYAKGGRPKGSKIPKTLAREAGRARALKEEEIDAARTMREIGHVAFSRIGQLFDEQGQLVSPRELPDAVQAVIASVKTLKTNLVSGDGAQEVTREVKLWNKGQALELLAKHFGLVTDKHEIAMSGQLELVAAALDRTKERNRAKSSSECRS